MGWFARSPTVLLRQQCSRFSARRLLSFGTLSTRISAAEADSGILPRASCRKCIAAATASRNTRPARRPLERRGIWPHGLATQPDRRSSLPSSFFLGPVPPLGAASCGLAVNSLHSPCAPLLPVWGVDRARHTVPPPPGRLALPSPPHRHPLHARASGSAAAACRGPPDHRLAAPFPPRCLQRSYAWRATRPPS